MTTIGQDLAQWMEGQLTEKEHDKLLDITPSEVFNLIQIPFKKRTCKTCLHQCVDVICDTCVPKFCNWDEVAK